MLYRKNSMRMNLNGEERLLKRKIRILLLACLFMVVACGIMGMMMMRDRTYRVETQQVIVQQMLGSLSSAVKEAGDLPTSAASDSQARLARVRQYVYHMEQLNNMSIKLAGGDSGRLIGQTALTTIYQDLNSFETILQGNKGSVTDLRAQLVSHLNTLQVMMAGK